MTVSTCADQRRCSLLWCMIAAIKGLCSPGHRILGSSSTCCKRRVDRPVSVCFCVKHALPNAHRGSFLPRARQSFLLEQGPPLCEECVSDALPHTGRSIDTHVRTGRGSAHRCQSACRSQSKDHSFIFCIPPAGQRSSDAPKRQKSPQSQKKAASAHHYSKQPRKFIVGF